ncbi:MAG: flagellar hook-associated protein FlgK [Phycisphaerales bacterium]
MSLSGAFQIGRSGLAAAQLGIQTAGNNVANAATPGYSRQVATQVPSRDTQQGSLFVGRGVEVASIRRQVDGALQARLLTGTSAESRANTEATVLAQVEATLNGLGDENLSTNLGEFFNAWSNLADNPTNTGTRGLVVQQGRTLADFIRSTRASLIDQRAQVDRDLRGNVQRADDLLAQIAGLNQTIVAAENGQGAASGLRDQRDALTTELSKLIDITTVEQADGNLDVLVGSTPVVLAGRSRGVQVLQEAVDGVIQVRVVAKDKQEELTIASGAVGALLAQRTAAIDGTLDQLDTLATNLIFEVNRIHSGGYGGVQLSTVTSGLSVPPADTALSLNDPTNATFAALPFAARNGSFLLTITNRTTGAARTERITIDLDGITNAGVAGFADDTSLASLQASVAAALGANGTATLGTDGRLTIAASTGNAVSFSEDSSGVLATIGINTYFKGTTASDIAVRDELVANSGLLAFGRVVNGQPTENGVALAITQLQTQAIDGLSGGTLASAWNDAVQNVGVATGAARTAAGAAGVVRENLDAQRQVISGVSIDEEAINLLNYQSQYQASARFISVIDELTQTLLSIVR